jgi:hypothetical protein
VDMVSHGMEGKVQLRGDAAPSRNSAPSIRRRLSQKERQPQRRNGITSAAVRRCASALPRR